MSKTFTITSKTHGLFNVIVDDEDFERVMKYNWSISKNGNYFRAETRTSENKLMRLHRFILGLKQDDRREIDHKNRNPMDNRKENLRIATRQQNARNMKCKVHPNKTGFIGVYRNNGKGKYRACISIDDKTFHIPGNYNTAKEAAFARDRYALRIAGEFAVLNFEDKDV